MVCDIPLRCIQPQIGLLTTHRRDPRYQLARGAYHFSIGTWPKVFFCTPGGRASDHIRETMPWE